VVDDQVSDDLVAVSRRKADSEPRLTFVEGAVCPAYICIHRYVAHYNCGGYCVVHELEGTMYATPKRKTVKTPSERPPQGGGPSHRSHSHRGET